MIGIVAVSHSALLGEAALELARQMVRGDGARVLVAAGAGTDAEGQPILGTDAVVVAGAIDELAADCDGVLVLMDLGSAVLSAELALELRASEVPVRLAPAPFVEGLLAGVVAAAAGAALDDVLHEAVHALAAKTGQLDVPDAPPVPVTPDGRAVDDESRDPQRVRRTVVVRNPLGIHARPAALIAEASAGGDVRLRRLPDGPEAAGASLSRLLVLGARQGDEIELSASGDAADAVLARLVELFDDGFGEGVGAGELGTNTAAEQPSSEPPLAEEDEPLATGALVRGRGVSAGTVAAEVVHLGPPVPEPDAAVVVEPEDRAAAIAAVERAAASVADQLGRRAERASGDARAILDASRLLASDPELVGDAGDLVRAHGRSAARAVWDAAEDRVRALAALGGRTAERAADVRDVRDRIVAEILGVELPGVPTRDDPFVLVAVDLAPADTAALEGGSCVALVTAQGGPTSHTAIIARSLGLPAVVAAPDALRLATGAMVLVDGDTGTILVAPTAAQIAAARVGDVDVSFDGRGRLADGRGVALLANVGGTSDAAAAARAGAEGVGLFRTEFCFLDRAEAPSVEEQVTAYRGVLAEFAGRRVVVRTLDAGSDKPLPFANSEHEENPALGVRGLRVARRRPDLLDDQLHALARAAATESARIDVMAPMVATVEEARDFAKRARAAGLHSVGVMIETPSAALLAEEILEVVDFVSLGTNDLAQYTLAADRLLAGLGDLNDPWQPSVLRLVAAVGDAGRSTGKPVGVCGEAAADRALAPVLVGLGVTSLSMAPRALGRVGAALAAVTDERCRGAAAAVLAAPTADDARAAASAVLDA